MNRPRFAAIAFVVCVTLRSFGDSEFERVVVPVWFCGHGANGSYWSTAFWIKNRANVSAVFKYNIYNGCPNFGTFCAAPMPARTTIAWIAGDWNGDDTMLRSNCSPVRREGGAILYPRREALEHLAYTLRVRSWSSSFTESFTADIPVVRESEFASHTVELIQIPLTDDHRIALRVYRLDGGAEPVYVEVRDCKDSSFSETITVPMSRPDLEWASSGGLRLTREMLAAPADVDCLSVEVKKTAGSGAKLWAFASVTSNRNNHFYIVTSR